MDYSPNQNFIDRQTLLQTGLKMRKKLGTFGPFSAGQSVKIRASNVGVLTGFKIYVSGKMTIATGAATKGKFGPYNVLKNVTFSDYNTTERIFAPGHMIAQWLTARNGWGWMNASPAVDTNQVVFPTAIVAPSAANFGFPLDIPICYDPKADLRGAILAQTVVGEMNLGLSFADDFDVDETTCYSAVASSGTAALTEIYVDVWQDFIQPQSKNLPLFDLQTVYEFAGNYTSASNLAVSQTKYLEYPNVRSVMGAYLYYMNAGVLTANETDISEIDLIANANTTLLQQTPRLIRQDMQSKFGGDCPSGFYYIDHRQQPIQTAIYGQVQLGVTPAVVTSTAAFIGYGFESMYAMNTPLPGIGQQ